MFDQSLKSYQDALIDTGFSNYLCCAKNKNNTNDSKRKLKRKITWFSPPFSGSVKTNIDKIFLQLLSKNFPTNQKTHKICGRTTVKISYSCIKNIGFIISAHNRSILNLSVQSYGCNFRVRNICPLKDECLSSKIIYTDNVPNNTNTEKNFYSGLADTPFKKQYKNHAKEFKHQKYDNITKLARYIWQLKCNNIKFSIKIFNSGKI